MTSVHAGIVTNEVQQSKMPTTTIASHHGTPDGRNWNMETSPNRHDSPPNCQAKKAAVEKTSE
jgi:hypothetical protein